MKRNNPVEFRKKLETFITKEAKLTPKEAKSFFPLFYELKEQQRAMQRKIGKASHRIEREDLTEKECEKILANMKKMEKQLLELEISYYEKWRKVLPASKILRVINADRHFGRKMFNKMVEQRKEKKGVTPSISR